MSNPFNDPGNPYAAPESALQPELRVSGVAGGTLEATLAGQTNWTIGEVFSDAWQLVSGFKGTFWLAILMTFGAQIVMNIAVTVVEQLTGSLIAVGLVALALLVLLLWPLQMGMLMLGVRRAAGAETKASMVGNYMSRSPEIAGLLILQGILITIGFVLLIIPGIYLAVSYLLAPQMLLDRRMGIWESLETSRKAIGTCWLRTFGLILVMMPIALLVPLTLGIAMIWILPMFVLILGVLYQRLAGYAGEEAA